MLFRHYITQCTFSETDAFRVTDISTRRVLRQCIPSPMPNSAVQFTQPLEIRPPPACYRAQFGRCMSDHVDPPPKKKKDAGLCYLVMRGIIDALETNTPIPTVTALPSLWID